METEEKPTRGVKIGRKLFVQASLASILGLSLPLLTPLKVALAPTKIDTLESESEGVIFETGGITVWGGNRSNVPRRWRDYLGNNGHFSLNQLLRQNENAMEEGEMNIASVTRVETRPQPEKDQIKNDKPKIERLPDDILTPEELRVRGLSIIGSGKVDLYIRRGAFEKEALLEDYGVGEGQKLMIILTDAATLTYRAFQDARYDSVRTLIEKVFGGENAKYGFDIVAQRREIIKGLLNKEAFQPYREILKIEEAALAAISEQESVILGLNTATSGYYLPPGHEQGLDNSAVIFLAVGNIPSSLSFLATKTYPVENMFVSMLYNLDLAASLRLPPQEGLKRQQSYPNPDDFRAITEDEKRGYMKPPAFVNRTVGFRLRHEAGHNMRILHPTGDNAADWSETETDLLAMKTVREATERLTESRDDSGYYFAFVDKEKNEIVFT